MNDEQRRAWYRRQTEDGFSDVDFDRLLIEGRRLGHSVDKLCEEIFFAHADTDKFTEVMDQVFMIIYHDLKKTLPQLGGISFPGDHLLRAYTGYQFGKQLLQKNPRKLPLEFGFQPSQQENQSAVIFYTTEIFANGPEINIDHFPLISCRIYSKEITLHMPHDSYYFQGITDLLPYTYSGEDDMESKTFNYEILKEQMAKGFNNMVRPFMLSDSSFFIETPDLAAVAKKLKECTLQPFLPNHRFDLDSLDQLDRYFPRVCE